MVTLNDFVPNTDNHSYSEDVHISSKQLNFTVRVTGTTKLLCSDIKTPKAQN